MPENNSYDAIVVGSAISGGRPAKELCDKGLKTLVLERSRPVPGTPLCFRGCP